MNSVSGERYIAGLALGLLLYTPALQAADVDYGFSAGIEQTDNIERIDTNGSDETIVRVGFDLNTSGESKRYTYDLNAYGQLLSYLNDTFSDEFLPAITFSGRGEIIPGRFAWIVDDRYGQIVRNTFNPDNPANRDDTNVFSTGPEFTLRLGSTTSMVLSARYINNFFDKQNIDNDRMTASVAMLRRFSPARSGSFVVSTERVEYDSSAAGSDFDRQEAFFRFQSAVSNGTVSVDIGGNALHDRGTSSSGLLARVNVVRQLANQIRFTLSAGTQFSDAGQIFLAGGLREDDFRRSEDVLASADPLRRDSINVSLTRPLGRGQIAARFDWWQDGYETQTAFDRDSLGIYLNYDHRFTRNLQGRLLANLVRQDFGTVNRDDDLTGLGAELNWSMSQKWWLTGGVYRYERDSSAAGADFDDLRAVASINYSYKAR